MTEVTDSVGKTAINSGQSLFDENGRLIPSSDVKIRNNDGYGSRFSANVSNPNYSERLARFKDTGLEPAISAFRFSIAIINLSSRLSCNPMTARILNGDCLPILVPQELVSDYGQSAEKFVVAAGLAYCWQFPGRQFKNHLHGKLKGKMGVMSQSRHEQLVVKIAQASMPALYFPGALPEFMAPDQYRAMAYLPPGFLLAGVLDSAAAWVMHAETLVKSGLRYFNCSAVQSSSGSSSFDWLADDNGMSFVLREGLTWPDAKMSGGLLYIGEN